jgi:hypothetical protein
MLSYTTAYMVDIFFVTRIYLCASAFVALISICSDSDFLSMHAVTRQQIAVSIIVRVLTFSFLSLNDTLFYFIINNTRLGHGSSLLSQRFPMPPP